MKLSDIFPALKARKWTWYRCGFCGRLSGWLSTTHQKCLSNCSGECEAYTIADMKRLNALRVAYGIPRVKS